MSVTLPIEVYEILEQRLGKGEAKTFVKAVETTIDEVSRQRKIETKDELSRELATKADIAKLEGKIDTEIAKLEGKLKLYFLILIFTIILVSPNAIDLIARIIGVVR